MMYKPKRKRYPALATLMKEMLDDKSVRALEYNGHSIRTKTHEYTMVDSEIYIEKLDKSSE